MADPILSLVDVHAGYDGVPVVFGVSLEVMPGEMVAVVGANGAGKSTTLRAVAGLNNPLQGTIRFEGRDISRLRPHQTLALGISYVPEGRRVFAKLSVEENLRLGAYTEKSEAEIRRRLDEMMRLFPVLGERARQTAETLSGGEQQMLAMGRGLMSRPKMVMIDEPSNGLAPLVVAEVFEILKSLHKEGITILLVEQNVRQTLAAADRAYVVENGHLALEGECRMLVKSDHVRKAYLGL